ncbi:hypothetical protein JL720_10769 [Aureococcus anophagefferens]|nr:hypothetical protein JL720_10769 [Aureococcus anophagefferens]
MDLVGLIDAVAAPLSLPADDSDAFRVFARKRPLWEREDEAGEYDSVTTCGGTVYVHDARLDREHRTLVEHREFAVDGAFDEAAEDGAVYEGTAGPLVDDALQRGGARATVVFFGQTGTGKTRSAVAFQERIAAAVFDDRDGFAVSVSCVEIRGKICTDLLGERARVKVLEGAAHEMHLHGAVEARADSKASLLEVLTAAAALRSVRATANNEQSSRSHCVFTLTVTKGDREPSVLRLVDLAGSERNDEQKRHARSAVLETVEINRTLSTLKDCFRAVRGLDVDHEVVKETWGYTEAMVAEYRSKKLEDWRRRGLDATDPRRLEWLEAQCNRRLASAVEFTKIKPLAAPRESAHARKLRCPYRDTLLSKLLADMFLSPKHRVAVVSTLSPSATDVEHSRRTLETVCAMRGAAEMVQRVITVAARQTLSEKEQYEPVVKWSAARVRQWLAGRDDFASTVRLKAGATGKDLLRLPKPRLRAFCGGDEALAAALFQALRDESKAQDARARAARNRKTALMRGEAPTTARPRPRTPARAALRPPSPAKAARPPAPPTNRCTFVSTGAGIMIHDGDARRRSPVGT